MGDISTIGSGGGARWKFRAYMCKGQKWIRRPQCHSSGSGVRPDTNHDASDIRYVAHGTSEMEARPSVKERQKKQLLRIHFYECGHNGALLTDRKIQGGAEELIAIAARRCVEDGALFTSHLTERFYRLR